MLAEFCSHVLTLAKRYRCQMKIPITAIFANVIADFFVLLASMSAPAFLGINHYFLSRHMPLILHPGVGGRFAPCSPFRVAIFLLLKFDSRPSVLHFTLENIFQFASASTACVGWSRSIRSGLTKNTVAPACTLMDACCSKRDGECCAWL